MSTGGEVAAVACPASDPFWDQIQSHYLRWRNNL